MKTLAFAIGLCILAAGAIGIVTPSMLTTLLDRWASEGPGLTRPTGIPLVALGGFIAYACQPTRRAY